MVAKITEDAAVFLFGLEAKSFECLFLGYIGFLLRCVLASPEDARSVNTHPGNWPNAPHKEGRELRSLVRVSPPADVFPSPEAALSPLGCLCTVTASQHLGRKGEGGGQSLERGAGVRWCQQWRLRPSH